LIPFDSNIILNILKKPKKYINSDKSPPPLFLAKPVEILFKYENRLIISYAIISIIVEIKIISFSVNDSTYLDYIIDKLSIIILLIAIHRANVKIYIDYKAAQERIKAHELNFIKTIIANKKKKSKKIINCSVVNSEI
jgi:hypothetical protein